MNIPRALTIAGSDSGGGAGIQADLKTFTAMRVYGLSVITALTAQNTVEVSSIHELPDSFIGAQFDSVLGDIGCDSAKTGMLSSSTVIECVADKLVEYGVSNIVVDPVMISKGGSRLLREDATRTLIERLIPLSLVITPNRHEAEALSGMTIKNENDMKKAAVKLIEFGSRNVIVKGGHIEESEYAVDILFDGSTFHEFRGTRIRTKNTHGTGCTYSSAICAGLARGKSLTDSIQEAKDFTTNAIKNSLNVGSGSGPLMHYWDIK